MKVLIAYDGSDCAGAAIEDLSRAGLPAAEIEAMILTATESWVPLAEEDLKEDVYTEALGFAGGETLKQMRGAAMEQLAEGERLAQQAEFQVQGKFPAWRVRHKIVSGFPERGIMAVANEWKPDLIVVGSHGRSAAGRFVLGSVSLRVLSEAKCSVRIARQPQARTKDDDSPLRIVIAVDGSPDSGKAIETVASRVWPPETSVRLITVIENLPYTVLLEELPEAEESRKIATEMLKQKGLHVSSVARSGRAKTALVEEAENWAADTVFIGAKGHGLLERFWLGSVSYAVAARAHCSVEVVRAEE